MWLVDFVKMLSFSSYGWLTVIAFFKPVDRGGSVGSDEPPRLPNGPLEVFKNYYTGYFWLHKLLLLV